MNETPMPAPDQARLSITCALGGSLAFSINDITVKSFSATLPLHEVVLFRALVALIVTVAVFAPDMSLSGVFRTRRLSAHLFRGFCVVVSNLAVLCRLGRTAAGRNIGYLLYCAFADHRALGDPAARTRRTLALGSARDRNDRRLVDRQARNGCFSVGRAAPRRGGARLCGHAHDDTQDGSGRIGRNHGRLHPAQFHRGLSGDGFGSAVDSGPAWVIRTEFIVRAWSWPGLRDLALFRLAGGCRRSWRIPDVAGLSQERGRSGGAVRILRSGSGCRPGGARFLGRSPWRYARPPESCDPVVGRIRGRARSALEDRPDRHGLVVSPSLAHPSPSRVPGCRRRQARYRRAGERVREPHEVRDRERLAARRRIDAGGLEVAAPSQSADERVAQRLAPLAERGGDDAREQRRVGDAAASPRRAARGARPRSRPSAPAGTRPRGTTKSRVTRNCACSITVSRP